jgi:hypothetical protein
MVEGLRGVFSAGCKQRKDNDGQPRGERIFQISHTCPTGSETLEAPRCSKRTSDTALPCLVDSFALSKLRKQ